MAHTSPGVTCCQSGSTRERHYIDPSITPSPGAHALPRAGCWMGTIYLFFRADGARVASGAPPTRALTD